MNPGRTLKPCLFAAMLLSATTASAAGRADRIPQGVLVVPVVVFAAVVV